MSSVSNMGCVGGEGGPSEGEPDCPGLVCPERRDVEGGFWRSVEDEDFVGWEVTSETNEGGICVGEGGEAPSWTGQDP